MMRIAFTMRLKPDALPEYRYLHDNLWPELAAEIERAGIARITTFQRGLDLFLVSEVEDEEAWERLWTSEVHQRWAERMRPLMQIRDDGIVETAELAEVFHFVVNGGALAPAEAEETAREPAPEIALAEPSSEAMLAEGSWQAAAESSDDDLDGETLVEAIVVALAEPPMPAARPRKSPARPALGKRTRRKKAVRESVKRKPAPPSKKRAKKKHKPAAKKKAAPKKPAPKKKAAKKSAAKKPTAKKKPAKNR
jgi:L-rhamnose mutarotase